MEDVLAAIAAAVTIEAAITGMVAITGCGESQMS